MKRFVKVMALFALFLLTLYVFDKLQPTITTATKAAQPTPLTTYAVYEVRQLQWPFDDHSDYSYDASLINLSSGEAKLRLQAIPKELKNQTPLTLPLKGDGRDGKYKKKHEFESEAYSYKGTLKTLSFSADKPPQTSVKLKIRTAGSQQALEEAEWQPKGKDYYATSPQNIAGEPNGYVQYKAVLETDDDAKTPVLKTVTISYEAEEYPAEATIATKEFVFERSVEVQGITADDELKGQTVKYEYSTDSGQAWKTPVSGQVLAAAADKILIKATLSSNKTETPAVRDIKLSYKISICDEKWQANYTSCGESNSRMKYYTDANSCGSTEDISADNGTAESCDYCIPQWTNVNSSCRNDDTIAASYFYTNSCCQETRLPSDCTIPPNTTATCDYCTPSFACNSYSDCSEANRKSCAQVNDTNNCYSQTGLPSDSYSGNYSEFATSCAYDNEKPSINSAIAVAIGNTLTVMANITDKSLITAVAYIIKDNNAVTNLTLTNTSMAGNTASNIYTASANAAELEGAYIVGIFAKDSYGNAALAKGIAGLTINAEKSAMKEIVINSTGKALIVLTDVAIIEVKGKAEPTEASVTGRIVVAGQTRDERNTTKPSGKKELNKYLEIEATEEVKSNVSSATIKINYNDQEVVAANISETSLALYSYNETSLLWQQLNSTANTQLNYVEGNTTHLSFFGIFGNEQNQTINATINATINSTTNATPDNNTLTNTTSPAANSTESTQQAQTQPSDTLAAANAAGGEGTGKAQEEIQKTQETTQKTGKAQESCSYNVAVEMEDKPSFVNKTSISAVIKNTGTCAIENLEVKVTQPLDDYIAIENGKAAQLEPKQSLTFTIKSKTAENGKQAEQTAQGQPLQGFAVKEQRKTSTQKGRIIITGNAIKETALGSKLPLQQEVPLNIEVYELEQKGGRGKSDLAVMITGLTILAMLLTITYNRIIKSGRGGSGNKGTAAQFREERNAQSGESRFAPLSTLGGSTGESSKENAESAEKEEAKNEEEKTTPKIIKAADHETLKFHESLKKFEEKLGQENIFTEKDSSKNEQKTDEDKENTLHQENRNN